MATKIIDRDLGMKRILRNLKKLKKAEVTVGFHKDAGKYPTSGAPNVAYVASIQERGPEEHSVEFGPRPFMRPVFDKTQKRLTNIIKKGINAVYAGRSTAKNVLDEVGRQHADDIKNFVIRDKVRPKTSSPVMDKKKTKITLVETQKLHDSIRHKVKL